MRIWKIIAAACVITASIAGIGWLILDNENVSLQNISTESMSIVLHYDVANPRLVHLLWQELRGDATTINIYRSRDGKTWELWKQVASPALQGSATFEVTEGELAQDFQYYVEVATAGGESVIVVQPSPLAPPPEQSTGQASTTTSTPSTSAPQASSSEQAATPTTPASPSTTTPPAQPVVTPPSPGDTSAAIYTAYYTPDGRLSGTSSIPLITATFWVRHIGNAVEIGWQNLPTETTSVSAYRATSSTGSWTRLLTHDNLSGTKSGSVRFIDGSMQADHYYKIESVAGDSITGTLGPLLLPGLP